MRLEVRVDPGWDSERYDACLRELEELAAELELVEIRCHGAFPSPWRLAHLFSIFHLLDAYGIPWRCEGVRLAPSGVGEGSHA